jgi:peptidyl-prolyl cis-trans isomerase SurA
VLKRRAARLVTTGVLLAVPVFGLTACRTSPDVAAYVGDSEITVAELEAAIDDRMRSNETIAAVAADQEEAYRRQVLNILVQVETYAAAAERYGIEVDADDVRDLLDERFGDQDPDAVYDQYAQQGFSERDLFEDARAALIRRGIAEAEGVEELEDSALQEQYEEQQGQFTEYLFGFITVADQATADAVLAQLTAAPTSYPAFAARYPGDNTSPELLRAGSSELPAVLAEDIAAAEPGTGFTTAVEAAGGVVVTFVADVETPAFEELRPQLAAEAADAAGGPIVTAFQEDLDVTLNPRFGDFEEGRVVARDGGVVQVLEGEPGA